MLRAKISAQDINAKITAQELRARTSAQELRATLSMQELAITDLTLSSYPTESERLINGASINGIGIN